jgi:tetratricopeptide (TPR) repeat protein
MSAATPPLGQRIHQAILAAFDRDELARALSFGMQERLDALAADKGMQAQVFDLLEALDQSGRVPELMRCLSVDRPVNDMLVALCAEAEGRQAQVGSGRPILGRLRPPGNPVPLQKPLRVQHFTGRAQELAQLLDDLQPGKAVTLCGPGGMGKSALAAEAIWTLAPGDEPPVRFPDGILFHTFYHQPQANLALEKIARAYGIDPRPTPRDAALQALAGKTALLVLDGAEQADDLLAVLAMAGNCGVLITTRRHADAPDAVQDVEPLPRAESLALLRAWAGKYAADDAAANDIVRLLGGLPLALYLCGRYLAQRHQLAEDYADWLKEEGLEALHFGERPTKSIPLLLRRSLEQVSEQAQAAFGVAGLLALAPFDPDTVAAALTAPPQRKWWQSLWRRKQIEAPPAMNTAQALGQLVDYGLLLRPDDSYQVTHALAHSYARTQAAPGAKLVNRLAMYYAAMAEAESAKGLPGYAVLDNQRAHIVAVQAAALKAEQWNAVRQTTWNMQGYLDLKGYWSERVIVAQAGLDAARAAGHRYDEGVFLTLLGMTYADLGESRRAIRYHEQGLAIARKIGDRRSEGYALGNMGVAYKNLGEPRRAVDLYEHELAIVRKIGDRVGEGAALGNLGEAYAALGETRRAIDLYEQTLIIHREIGDRRGEGTDLGNLGEAYAALGETRRAIDLYEQQLVIVLEIGDRRGEGDALGNLGAAYYALGEPRRAIDLYEQQLVIVRAIGDRRGEGNALGNLGIAYADLGEPRRAIDLYEQQLVIVRAIGDRRGEGNGLGHLGIAYADLGEPRRAIDLYEQQLIIMREIGDRRGEAIASWNLGLAYEKEGDLAQAIAYMQVLVKYEQELGHPSAEGHAKRVAELRAHLETSS